MKKLISLTAALFAAVIVLSSGAFAHESKIGDLTIKHSWARATAKSAKTSAAYFMISNAGSTDDKLINVKSNQAKKTETHLSSMKDGMMKMARVDGISIPAGGKAELKPGSYHIMFMGIKAPFVEKTSFPLTLIFEKAGEITIDVPVKKGRGMKHKKHKTN
jgi:copper(I)-binding protein